MRPQSEEEEERLLLQELEDVRDQTKKALESSWAEVEQLRAEELKSTNRLAELEREWQARCNHNSQSEEDSDVPHLEDEDKANRLHSKKNNLLTRVTRRMSADHLLRMSNQSFSSLLSNSSSIEDTLQSNHDLSSMSDDDDDDDETSFVPFVSNEERHRRRQSNESSNIPTESRSTANNGTINRNQKKEEEIMMMGRDMKAQLDSLEHGKQLTLEELQETLRGKEETMEALAQTTTAQAQTINQLQAELAQLQRQTELDESNAVADMDAIRQEIAKNEATSRQLEQQIQSLENTLDVRREEEHALQVELVELTQQVEISEKQSESYLQELQDKLDKTHKAKEEYQQQYDQMQEEKEETLARLDVEPEIQEIIRKQFCELQQHENALADILVTRMQERESIIEALNRMERLSSQFAMDAENPLLQTRLHFDSLLQQQENQEEKQYFPTMEDSKQTQRWTQSLDEAASVQQGIQEDLIKAEEELKAQLVSLGFPPFDENDENDEELDREIQELRQCTKNHEQTMQTLRTELAQLEKMTEDESRNSNKVIDKLQQEVNAIVQRVSEKDQLIVELTNSLQEKQCEEAKLLEEENAKTTCRV